MESRHLVPPGNERAIPIVRAVTLVRSANKEYFQA
jgi:hypothetical protein